MAPKKSNQELKKSPHVRKKSTHEIKNYEEFLNFVDNLPEKPHAYFLFSGNNQENGRSWCISCQLADPVVRTYLGEVKKSFIFGFVQVGEREYWRDSQCPFRTDKRTRLSVIPTLIKWKCVRRLEGSQCNKRDLLQLLFEDDEEEKEEGEPPHEDSQLETQVEPQEHPQQVDTQVNPEEPH